MKANMIKSMTKVAHSRPPSERELLRLAVLIRRLQTENAALT